VLAATGVGVLVAGGFAGLAALVPRVPVARVRVPHAAFGAVPRTPPSCAAGCATTCCTSGR
jgi:hypothetical protein